LSLHAFYNEDSIDLMWEYATALFEPERIERMSEHFTHLLQGIVNNPDANIDSFALLSKTENQQLLQWSQTGSDPQQDPCTDKSIIELFQAQVDKTPNNIAVLFEEQQITYAQLNQKANQLAHHLKQHLTQDSASIQADTFLVAICVERSADMIIGLLAILKAGGAYVPLDPTNPQERLRHMLQDTQVPLILTQTALKSQLPETDAVVICLDAISDLDEQANQNLDTMSSPEDLAYVMYTSGSTGKPKGVCVPHRAVVRLVKDTDYAVFDDQQTFLQYAPVSFDASTLEIWGALLHGRWPMCYSNKKSPCCGSPAVYLM
ncbi:MAG: AMP-binding protein, partial [Psychrosphaera sp.]|nr:AMP-binding protein [Psychrosphaera sp.]